MCLWLQSPLLPGSRCASVSSKHPRCAHLWGGAGVYPVPNYISRQAVVDCRTSGRVRLDSWLVARSIPPRLMVGVSLGVQQVGPVRNEVLAVLSHVGSHDCLDLVRKFLKGSTRILDELETLPIHQQFIVVNCGVPTVVFQYIHR